MISRHFISRSFAYLQRFSVACENFGLLSAVKLFTYYRWKSVPGGISVYVKKLGRRIFFRGKTDRGVLTHFYFPGYRIRDTKTNPVRIIIDAGANIGDETIRFRHFHPEATIVAIEPDPDNCRMLSKNVGSDRQIEILNNGLWSHECRLRVIRGASAEAFHVEEVANDPEHGDVEAISIPSIMSRFLLDEIDILKMDIEGAEYEVFSASNVESWIDRVKVLIFECPDADCPGTTQMIFSKIADHQFSCHVHGECLVLIRRDTGWGLESNTYLNVSAEK